MNNQPLTQSRQTPTRSVNVRSPGKSGVKSPTYRGDYAQTRNLPSTNPIRAPTPDLMPRHERISSTAVPNGLRFTNKKKQNYSVSPQRGGFRDVDEVTEQFNRILKEKNDQIDVMKRQLADQDVSGRRGPSESDVTKLINELQHLNTELTKSRQNEIRLSSMIQNYENQINKLTDVNMKLSQELKEVGEQNQYLLSQLQGQNPDGRIREIQLKHADELNALHAQLREAQLAAERNQNSQIDQLKRQNSELVNEVERLTNFVRTLQQELNAKGDSHQLTLVIQQRNQELEDWKNRYNLLAEERSRMEQKIVLAQTEMMRLEQQVNIWKEHCNSIQKSAPDADIRINELQNKIAHYESQINVLTLEIQKLNQLLQLKDEDNEKIKRANRQSNVDSRTLDALQNEIYQKNGDLSKKDSEIIQLKQKIRDFEGNGQKTQQELTSKIIILTNEIDTVTTHLKARNQEYEDLAKRYNQLLQQTSSLNQSGEFKYQEQLNKSLQLGQEIEKLAALTRNQADEIRELKNRYAELEARYNQQIVIINSQTNETVYRRQIQDLEDQLRRKTAEAAEWQQSFVNLQAQKEREINNLMETLKSEIRKSNTNLNLQNEYIKLKESVTLLTSQIEQLNRINIEKDNEIRLLRNQVGSDAATKEKIINLENKIVIITSELQNVLHKNQILDNENQSLKRQLEEIRGRYNSDAEAQLIQLRQQIQTLQQLLQQKENTINDLNRQIYQLSSQNEDVVKRSKKDDDASRQIEELKQANQRLSQLNQEYTLTIDRLNRQVNELQQSSQNIQEYTRKIESLLYQIQVLEGQFRTVAEERDNLRRQLLETDSLRGRIRELEVREAYLNEQINRLNAELLNAQSENVKRSKRDGETHGLQVRIKELENENEILKGENNKLRSIINMKDQDLESLRRESSRKNVVDAEKSQLENKILLLASEIDRLSRNLQDKHEEVKRLNMLLIEKESSLQRVHSLESRVALLQDENNRLIGQIKLLTEDSIRKLTEENLQLRQRLSEMSDFDRQKTELENRLAMFSSERERLNQIITTMTQEKLSLQAQLNEYAQGDRIRKELEYQIESIKREKQRLEEVVQHISNENNELRLRLQGLNEIDRIKIEYENKIVLLSSELERLHAMLNAKNEDYSKLLVRVNEFSNLEKLRIELESRIQIYAQDQERLNQIIRRLTEDNTSLQTRISQLSNIESLRIQMENQINLLVAENKRLNDLVRAKDEELVSVRDIRQRFELYQTRNIDALAKLTFTLVELERVSAENREKGNRIIQLEMSLKNNNFEYQKNALEQRIAQLTEQTNRLVNELDAARNELINISRKYQILESEKLGWNEQRVKLEQTISYLQAELNRLNGLADENEKVKKNKQVNDSRLFDLENQNKYLNEQLERMRADNSSLSQKVIEMTNIINELQYRLNDDSLQRKLQEQEQTINYLTSEVNRLSQLGDEHDKIKRTKREGENKIQELENQIKYLSETLDISKRENAKYLSDISELRQTLQILQAKLNDSTLEVQNKYLQEQVERLRGENSQLIKQINELTIVVNQLQIRVNDNSLEIQLRALNGQIEALNIEKERVSQLVIQLRQQNDQLTMELNRVRGEYSTFEVTKRTLEAQLREQSSRLEILTNELNRLNQINIELNSKLASSGTIHERYARISEAYVLQAVLIETLSKKIGELAGQAIEIEESRKRQQNHNQERDSLFQKISQLEARIQELYGVISQREREIQDLKAQNASVSVLQMRLEQYEKVINDLRQRHAEELESVKRSFEGIRQSSVQREINELTIRFNIRIQELEKETQKFKLLAEQFENELRAQRQQNSDLLQRLVEAEGRARENDEQVKRSKQGQQHVQSLEERISQLTKELEQYKNLYAQEKAQCVEYESQKSILAIEIERLNTILKEKLVLIEEYQRRESEWRNAEGYKYEVQNLRTQLEERNRQIDDLVRQIRELQQRLGGISEFESKINLLTNQIQTLNFTLEQREKEKQQLLARINELTLVITQLKTESEQYASYKYQIEALQRENEQLRQHINQITEVSNQKDLQIVQLQQRLSQLENDYNMLKYQTEKELNDDKVKRSKKDKDAEDLNKRVESLIQEITRLQGEIALRDKRIQELSNAENTIRMFQFEKEQLLRERESLTLLLNKQITEKEGALQRVVFLSARVESIEEGYKGLNIQIQILTQQLQAKEKELRDLITLYQELSIKYNQEIESSRRSSSMAGSKFLQEKQQLEQEIARLRSELSIVEHRHNLTIEEIKRQMELQLAEELRKQLAAAKAEYERRLTDALNAQREQYEDDLVKRSKAHQGEVNGLKNQLELNIKIQLEQQLKDLQMRMENERRQIEDENRVLRARNAQLEEQVKMMQKQLMDALGHEQDTLKWKEIVERLEMQRQREISEFRQILEESRSLHIDSSGSLAEAERVAYNTQIKQLSLRVSELVENLKIKDQENNELRGANAKIIREKSEMKMQLSTSNANVQYQMEIESLKRAIIQANDGKIEYETQIKRLLSKVNQYEIQINQMASELDKANEQLSVKKMERDSAFNQIDQLKSQTLSMSQAFSSAGGDIDLQRSKFEVLSKEIEELTIQRNMYKEQSERKSDELNRKNLELVEKIGQLDQLKLKYEENNNKMYILETKLLDKLQTEEVHIM